MCSFSSSMLPPSGSQRFHQFPPYSDVDSFLTPLLVAWRPHACPPAPLLQGDFCAYTEARICRTSTYHCTTANISETKRERCKNCYMYISLVGSCPCSRITATAENFWKVLETTPFLHSLLQHLLWKVLGLVHFRLHLQFPWYSSPVQIPGFVWSAVEPFQVGQLFICSVCQGQGYLGRGDGTYRQSYSLEGY